MIALIEEQNARKGLEAEAELGELVNHCGYIAITFCMTQANQLIWQIWDTCYLDAWPCSRDIPLHKDVRKYDSRTPR